MAKLIRICRTVEVVAQESSPHFLWDPININAAPRIKEVADLDFVYSNVSKTLLAATAVGVAEIARSENLRTRRIANLLGKCSFFNGIFGQVHTL